MFISASITLPSCSTISSTYSFPFASGVNGFITEKIAVEMGSRMSGTSIEVLDGEYKGVRVLWNGLTEAREGEFIFLEGPYVNRLTDGDGPLVFVRQPDGAA